MILPMVMSKGHGKQTENKIKNTRIIYNQFTKNGYLTQTTKTFTLLFCSSCKAVARLDSGTYQPSDPA
jgi:hypothetical protein